MTVIPHDVEAERALVGSMIIWPAGIMEAIEYVMVDDLYTPLHKAAYAACIDLALRGDKVDSITVADECKRKGHEDVTVSDVIRLTSGEGGLAWKRYADIILQHSLRRRLLAEAYELQESASDISLDPAVVMDRHLESVARIDTALIAREPDDISVEEFLQRPSPAQSPWVVPGLFRRDWRTIVVGGEGKGKSWLLRQLGVLAAYGIHPFRFTRIPKVKTLIVDLENPEDALWNSLDTIVRKVQRQTPDREVFNRLWWRPSGIDLRSRSSRAELESVIAQRRPELVLMGPLYKTYSITARDGFELPAREVQQALDTMRMRYGFSLVIEDHAPQASGGVRDMRPYGSSFWLRWPEIGIGLVPSPEQENALTVGRWRGDRTVTDWPATLVRGTAWPWEGIWKATEPF